MIDLRCTTTNIFWCTLTATLIFLAYFKRAHTYWIRRNVPQLPAKIPLGHINTPLGPRKPLHVIITEIYNSLKAAGHKHGGFYIVDSPFYLAISPEYVKRIVSRDFQHFANNGRYYNEKVDPLSAHLLALEDDRWKNLRAKLSPTFSSGRMKVMFQTLLDCTVPLTEEIRKSCVRNEYVGVKELVSRFTTDVIGSCVFGIECNSCKNPEAEFRKYGKEAFEGGLAQRFKVLMILIWPKIAYALNMGLHTKDVSDFFLGIVRKTVAYRESGNCVRSDFMQLLIELKNKEDGLSVDEIAAQAFVFFLAGFETSSTTLTYALYELAKQQSYQEKVRKEIERTLKEHNGEITYDSIGKMTFLGQIIDETLRKYPPAPLLCRICTKTYHVPETNVTIEKGTRVMIPLYSLHHDPEYFPDPERFLPERFAEEEKSKIQPNTYMPFGDGPRICIGVRFGKMQVRCGLVVLLKKFKFRLHETTPLKLTMDANSIMLSSVDDVNLEVEEVCS